MSRKNNAAQRKLTGLITGCFCLLLVIAMLIGRLPIIVLVYYAVLSLVTFVMYAIDKSAAKKGQWRTQERTLHLLSLIGGWPGGFYAQNRLRHKTSKPAFKTVFWITAVINAMLLAYLLTDHGAFLLRNLNHFSLV